MADEPNNPGDGDTLEEALEKAQDVRQEVDQSFPEQLGVFADTMVESVDKYNAGTAHLSGISGNLGAVFQRANVASDKFFNELEHRSASTSKISLMSGATAGLESMKDKAVGILGDVQDNFKLSTEEFKKLGRGGSLILAAKGIDELAQKLRSFGFTDIQKQFLATQRAATQLGVVFGETGIEAEKSADKMRQSYIGTQNAFSATDDELSKIREGFKDTLGAEAQIKALQGLSDAHTTVGATANMTNMAMLMGAATGQDFGDVASQMSNAIMNLGEDMEGSVKMFGTFREASKGSGLSMNLVSKSLLESAQGLKYWGGTVGSVAPVFKAFSNSLEEGRKGLAPELLEKYASGLQKMSFSQRAFLGIQSGMGGGPGGALGAGLQMEAALEQGEGGMEKVAGSLVDTLKKFGGGQVLTREQALENPDLSRHFIVQRQLLGQMLNVDEASANKMLGMLQNVDKNGLSMAGDQAKAMDELITSGRDIRQGQTNIGQEAEAKTQALIKAGYEDTIEALKELGESSGITSALRGIRDAVEEAAESGGFSLGRSIGTFKKSVDASKPLRDQQQQQQRRPPRRDEQTRRGRRRSRDQVAQAAQTRPRSRGLVANFQQARSSGRGIAASLASARASSQQIAQTFSSIPQQGVASSGPKLSQQGVTSSAITMAGDTPTKTTDVLPGTQMAIAQNLNVGRQISNNVTESHATEQPMAMPQLSVEDLIRGLKVNSSEGEIITREDARANPELIQQFMIQRQLLEEGLGVDTKTATEIIGVLKNIDDTGTKQDDNLKILISKGRATTEPMVVPNVEPRPKMPLDRQAQMPLSTIGEQNQPVVYDAQLAQSISESKADRAQDLPVEKPTNIPQEAPAWMTDGVKTKERVESGKQEVQSKINDAVGAKEQQSGIVTTEDGGFDFSQAKTTAEAISLAAIPKQTPAAAAQIQQGVAAKTQKVQEPMGGDKKQDGVAQVGAITINKDDIKIGGSASSAPITQPIDDATIKQRKAFKNEFEAYASERQQKGGGSDLREQREFNIAGIRSEIKRDRVSRRDSQYISRRTGKFAERARNLVGAEVGEGGDLASRIMMKMNRGEPEQKARQQAVATMSPKKELGVAGPRQGDAEERSTGRASSGGQGAGRGGDKISKNVNLDIDLRVTPNGVIDIKPVVKKIVRNVNIEGG